MDCVISTFLSDVFERNEPNLDRFKVDIKSLDFSEVVEFIAMLLYAETIVLSGLMKTCQNTQRNDSSEYIHQVSDRARAVVLQMDSQASFLAEKCPDLSTNTIRLSIGCMKKCGKIEEWTKYHLTLSTAIHKLVSMTIPTGQKTPSEESCTKTVPFCVLFSQLSEFVLHKKSDNHPSLWIDNMTARSRLRDVCLRFRRHNDHVHQLVDYEKIIASWQGALNVPQLFLSVATQTDAVVELKSLPQSTPIKNCQMKKLLPNVRTNLLDGFSTPPDSPIKDLPKSKVPKKARNLSLTLPSCDQNDAASTVTDCVARRRMSWTLSETLILWHAVQLALPNPPSWAKIRDEFFTSSRRTNVDLKDRWRVIMRDPALQTYVRQCYDKWLASKNPT
ncbi:hypothetical protein TcWFU_006088 [Taenia crassiceps]|uniref:Myb-like domain-containing protein n=1 Tax=Taenia crassiceps TaxID=6207 RepID=A0ABR4QRU3_9CEST